MALDFPNAPTNGEVYTDAGTGEQWIYEAATNSWTSKGLVNTTGGVQYKGDINITATPPTGVTSGWQYSVNPGGTANAGFGPGVAGTVAKGSMVMYTGTGWVETSHAVPDATPAVKGIDTRKWNRTGTVLSPATAGDDVNIGGTNISLKANGSATFAGKVGIGTATPLHNLDISGPSARLNNGANASTNLYFGPIQASSDYSSINWDNTAGSELLTLLTTGGGIRFSANKQERVRIDYKGRLLVGASTARGKFFNTSGQEPVFQVESLGGPVSTFTLNSATTKPGRLVIAKSRGLTAGSNVIAQNSDGIGSLSFQASDGSEMVEAALIGAEVDSTPGANDMPGRLVFGTTPAGASAPTARMTIKSSGVVNITATTVYADNTAALAGGLVAGDIYRKSDGTLMITF